MLHEIKFIWMNEITIHMYNTNSERPDEVHMMNCNGEHFILNVEQSENCQACSSYIIEQCAMCMLRANANICMEINQFSHNS